MDQILSTCFRLGSGLTLTSTGAENHQPQIDETLTLLPNGNGNWFGGELEKKKSGEQAKQSSRKEKQQCDLGRGEQRATASPYQAQRCFSIFWFIGLGRPTMTRSQVLARLWLRARRLDTPPQAAGSLANCRESFKSQRLVKRGTRIIMSCLSAWPDAASSSFSAWRAQSRRGSNACQQRLV